MQRARISVPTSPLTRTAAAAVALVLLLASLQLASPRAHAAPVSDVCSQLQAEAEAFDGRVGLVVLDLTDWSRCSYNATDVFITASLYKLIVLAEAYEQAEAGTFSFDDSISIGGAYVTTGTEAARLMIQVSDNATAEALRLGLGRDLVAAAPDRLGMTSTVLGTDFTTTAADIAHFFASLHAGRVVSPQSDAEMRELLLGQQVRDRIPALLPAGTEIAHKTGNLDFLAHDAGIVYSPAVPFVLVLLTESGTTQEQGREAIRTLAAAAFAGFAEPRADAVPPSVPPFSDLVATEGVAAAAATELPSPDFAGIVPAVASAADGDAEPASPTSAGVEQEAPAQAAPDSGGGSVLRLPEIDLGGLPWWQTLPGLLSMAAAVALVPFAMFGLRRRRRPLHMEQRVDYVEVQPERRPVPLQARGSRMRLGKAGKRSITGAEAVQTFMPGSSGERSRSRGDLAAAAAPRCVLRRTAPARRGDGTAGRGRDGAPPRAARPAARHRRPRARQPRRAARPDPRVRGERGREPRHLAGAAR